MRVYLCIEHGDLFHLEAENLAQAKEYALGYGGEVIGELTPFGKLKNEI